MYVNCIFIFVKVDILFSIDYQNKYNKCYNLYDSPYSSFLKINLRAFDLDFDGLALDLL